MERHRIWSDKIYSTRPDLFIHLDKFLYYLYYMYIIDMYIKNFNLMLNLQNQMPIFDGIFAFKKYL